MKLSFIHRNTTNTPHAPSVILLHGVFGQARNLGAIQRTLSPYFNCYAFDMRSHGKSPHAPLSYPEMAQDVLETIDSLGLEKVSLIGHSMGGKVAMATALYAPQRIEKLLIGDIAPAPTGHGQKELAEKLRALQLPPLQNRQEIHDYLLSVTNNATIAHLIGQHIQAGTPAQWIIGIQEIADSFALIEDWNPETWANFPPHAQWNGPTLFLKGGNSPYIRPEHETAIKSLFPNAQIDIIEQAGHWLHAEKPEEFCSSMLRFLGATT